MSALSISITEPPFSLHWGPKVESYRYCFLPLVAFFHPWIFLDQNLPLLCSNHSLSHFHRACWFCLRMPEGSKFRVALSIRYFLLVTTAKTGVPPRRSLEMLSKEGLASCFQSLILTEPFSYTQTAWRKNTLGDSISARNIGWLLHSRNTKSLDTFEPFFNLFDICKACAVFFFVQSGVTWILVTSYSWWDLEDSIQRIHRLEKPCNTQEQLFGPWNLASFWHRLLAWRCTCTEDNK